MSRIDSKVNSFIVMNLSNTFDELALHHDVCFFSFSKIHMWIKKRTKRARKAWMKREVDWGLSISTSHILNQDIRRTMKTQRTKQVDWGPDFRAY